MEMKIGAPAPRGTSFYVGGGGSHRSFPWIRLWLQVFLLRPSFTLLFRCSGAPAGQNGLFSGQNGPHRTKKGPLSRAIGGARGPLAPHSGSATALTTMRNHFKASVNVLCPGTCHQSLHLRPSNNALI